MLYFFIKMLNSIYISFIVLYIHGIRGECNLSLHSDFGHPSPVYLRNGGFLSPDADSGNVTLRRAESLEVACPGMKTNVVMANASTGQDVINIKCVGNVKFKATKSSWVGNLKEVSCNQAPWFTTEEAGASCFGHHKLYRVGYRISGEFHALYEVCFDHDLITTLYVKEVLSPKNKHSQTYRHRPSFLEGEGFFDKKSMNKLYKIENQRSRFDALLGSGMGQKYVTKSQYLSRGHLAPRADFVLRAEQRASFHYINSSPQWQRGNAGDWAALEEALRRRVHSYGSPVTVYTGTYGVSTLPDTNKIDTELYLDVDANNNGIVPIPLYLYKVVHDEKNHTAVAFISINSSYYNTTTIDKLSFCYDICDQNPKFKWLKWRPRDGTHSFCCNYNEFKQHIHHLSDLKVKDLFY